MAKLFAFLFLFVVSARAGNPPPGYDGGIFMNALMWDGERLKTPLRGAPSFFDRFQADRARYNDYTGFLEYLQGTFPEFFQSVVLVHHSQSLQPSSFENPRAILSSRGAFLSFSEHPSQGSSRTMELIETAPDGTLRTGEIAFANGAITFRDRPKTCVACHGGPPRLIWDPYDAWPLAYGATIGRIGSDLEMAKYEAFKKNAKAGIYSRLDFGAMELQYHSDPVELIGNERITNDAATLNALAWARDSLAGIEQSPGRYLLLGALSCNFDQKFRDQLKDFAPPALLPKLTSAYDTIYADTLFARTAFKGGMARDYGILFPGYKSDFSFAPGTPERIPEDVDNTAALRLSLEGFGFSHFAATSPHSANDYLITVPSNDMALLATVLYDARPALFTGLKLKRTNQEETGLALLDLDCKDLAAKSRAALAGAPALPASFRSYVDRAPRPASSALSNCIACHGNNRHDDDPHFALAPTIPFDSALGLSGWLAKDPARKADLLARIQGGDSRQMPLNGQLNDDEKAALTDYVERVSHLQ